MAMAMPLLLAAPPDRAAAALLPASRGPPALAVAQPPDLSTLAAPRVGAAPLAPSNGKPRPAASELLTPAAAENSTLLAVHTLAYGVAFDAGRLAWCTVCLDGLTLEFHPTELNGKCDPWEPQARTEADGQYVITAPYLSYSLDAKPSDIYGVPPRFPAGSTAARAIARAALLLEPRGECINMISKSIVRAPLRCANTYATTDEGTPYPQDVSACSPLTDLSHRVEAISGQNATAAARTLATGLHFASPYAALRLDPTTVSTINKLNAVTLRITHALRKIEVWEELAMALLFQWQSDPIRRGRSFRDAVSSHMRDAIARDILSANATAPLPLRSPERLSHAIASTARQVLSVNATASAERADALLAVSLAGTRLIDLMDATIPTVNDPTVWTFETDLQPSNVGEDEWFRVQEDFAQYQQLGMWLAARTADLGGGVLDDVGFAAATTTDALKEALADPSLSVDVRLGCLDAQSASFDFGATLNLPQACFFSESGVGYEFLRMNAYEWAFFLLTAFSDAWLFITAIGVSIYCCKVGKLMDKAVADIKMPRVAVFIPCYMPNEAPIILETLEVMTSAEYDGQLDFYVVYNTPHDMEIEKELAKLKSLNGRKVHCQRVPGSTSKADNLEYGLLHYTEKGSICVLFDADHHPRKNTIRGLVAVLLQTPDVVAVQGAVLIERGGPWVMRRLLDGMEFTSWSMYAPGFSELVGSAYFGGGNAAWRVEPLHALGFDHDMLTEDIDVSIRTLAAGHKMVNAPFLQVGEMCPGSLGSLYKQRLRWAMGWEQVTMRRIAALFSSPHISEPRKWRVFLILTSRYITLLSSALGVFNLAKQAFFNFYLPLPCTWAGYGSIGTIIFLLTLLGIILVRQKEPWQRWVSCYVFAAVSLFYFYIQLTMIVISIFKLTCCKSRTLEWVPTSRGKGSEAPPSADAEKDRKA